METENYIWEKNNMLGKGAFGSVYKARCKLNGEIVAAKVLNLPQVNNKAYYLRAIEMQNREIDIMKKYNHKNIVKLINVERLQNIGHTLTVIVMEMCTGGSLHDILEEPQNWKGLEETLFCQVLFDLASAMEYLKENEIVHRDIKPLNIMCQINDNGQSTFKLIDFGYARHLPENLPFTSIVGTEEYLHPDIYERGVMRNANATTDFSKCVDLWSVGVTLYHAATGELPFKPYDGPRKDQTTMFKMISKKPAGSISAMQLAKNGPITWHSELPEECNLSRGLKNLITPLLQDLLCSKEEDTSFEKFFKTANCIKQKTVFFVFDTTSSQIERIYVDAKDGFASIKEHIARLTNTSAANQILLFENLVFESINMRGVMMNGDNEATVDGHGSRSYPKTWLDNPIYMFGSTIHSDFKAPQLYEVCTEQLSHRDYYEDVLKMHLQGLYCNKRVVYNVILRQRLIIRAAKMYQLWFDRKVCEVKDDIVKIDSLLKETGKRIELSISYSSAVNNLLGKSCNKTTSPSTYVSKMEEAKLHSESHGRQCTDLTKLRIEMEELCKCVYENPVLWINQTFCNAEDACEERVENSLTKIDKMKSASDNWKKFEKLEMERISKRAFNHISQHCIPRLTSIFSEFNNWYRNMLNLKTIYDECLKRLVNIEKRHIQLTTAIDKVQDKRRTLMSQSDDQSLMDTMATITLSPTTQPISVRTTHDFNFVIPRRSRSQLSNDLRQLQESLSANNQLQAGIFEDVHENDVLLENLSMMTLASENSLMN